MSTDTERVPRDPSQTVSSAARLTVIVGQVCVIAVIGWLMTIDVGSDAGSTRVDWRFITVVSAIPCSLAVSCWIGFQMGRRAMPDELPPIRFVARAAQWLSLGLLALAVLTVPLAVLGAFFFGPIG